MEDGIFYTLQDFMWHNENVTYILLGISLVIMVFFWTFLTERDSDD